ncbi:hypothetical protein LCGC14_2104680 [marine sediment metagenome]|uniref:Uncharacterized protein n=1 Tax=marine sediment metagenome TaxID=412755 RepID=A0A0F9E937_9ZZZZ
MGKHKRMPDQDMLDKMWETYTSTESPNRSGFDYSVRCGLGEPTIVTTDIKDDDGLTIGHVTWWQYNQRKDMKRSLLGQLRYGAF